MASVCGTNSRTDSDATKLSRLLLVTAINSMMVSSVTTFPQHVVFYIYPSLFVSHSFAALQYALYSSWLYSSFVVHQYSYKKGSICELNYLTKLNCIVREGKNCH